MRIALAIVILSSALSFPAFAEDAVTPDSAPVQDSGPPPVAAQPEPEIAQPSDPQPVGTQPIIVTPPVENMPEVKADIPADPTKVEAKPVVSSDRNQNDRNGRDRKKWPDRNHSDRDGKNHDWKNNDWKKDRDHSYRPRVVYRRAPPKIVYIYPQSYYPTNSYYESYTTYPNGYVVSYHVGGYLPPEREWRPLPDYVRYGLPAPRRGELWVYNDRDAVLINDETSRIISGFVLAAPVD